MVKTFFNLILTIYIVISFIILVDPNWVINNCNQTIAEWIRNNYDIFYTAKIINFVFCYLISLFTFYLQGYNDAKKERIIENKENVNE